MRALVVGGTSGLGLELARLLKINHKEVVITGRTDPKDPESTFFKMSLESGTGFPLPMDQLVDDYTFGTVVYNPGFYQEGRISDLSDRQILDMVNVGFLAAAMLIRRILLKQGRLERFVAITSTSQWTPRELEPVYTAVKAALGMFANSLSLDQRVGRTLVVGPSGMNTKFWAGTHRDMSVMLDPRWVAGLVIDHLFELPGYTYKHIKILRDPPRVEVTEIR
ncbi:MAG TPA: SDR family oxidoreductase [Candidatus Paceibacterota bacterium]|nr:SDR family oxidoreductase [Candidatus Paceibacterota bacterium]